MVKKFYIKVINKLDILLKKRMSMICYRSKILSTLYYLLFDKSFAREQRAVLVGKVKHIKDAEQTKENYFMLVRNIHRLEKGLLMRPRRSVYAKDYIGETINCFEGVWNNSVGSENEQMKWFYDVLSEYFSGSGDTDPFIAKLHARFRVIVDTKPRPENGCSTVKSIPYFRLEEHRSNISYEELLKLSKHRRSVRWFLNKEVPRSVIDKALLIANQSPSACNRQPFEFRIIDDPKMVSELVSYPMGTIGYGHTIPVMIVVVGNLDAYFDERDRHVIYIDASLANMSFMLALETLGLGSCSINWPDMEEREQKMEKFLKLEKYQRPIMCMGIGYPDPDGMVAFSEKRPLDMIRRYN